MEHCSTYGERMGLKFSHGLLQFKVLQEDPANNLGPAQSTHRVVCKYTVLGSRFPFSFPSSQTHEVYPQTSNIAQHAHSHTRTNTQTHKHAKTQTHKHTNTQTHKHTNTQTHKHTNTQTQTHRHTETQTHRHTDFL